MFGTSLRNMALNHRLFFLAWLARIASSMGTIIPLPGPEQEIPVTTNFPIDGQPPKFSNLTNWHTASDGNLSELVNDDFMLVADYGHASIFTSSLEEIQFNRLPIANVGHPWAVDYDPVLQMVFWVDYTGRAIKKAHLDGSDFSVIVSTGMQSPRGIAVDPANKVVYWTDSGTDKIEAVNYDGSGRKHVLYLPSRRPFAIVIHFSRRELYWANYESSIERADWDGSNERTLVNTSIRNPDGIALNYEGTRVYWCDENYNRIETSDLLGNDRRIILALNMGTEGIAWHNGDIYWTDYSYRAVGIVNEESGNYRWIGSGTLSAPYDIHVVSSNQDSSNWTCDFDTFGSNLCGWQQSYHDDFDWSRRSGPTFSNTTGPSYDHTRDGSSGYYMYTDASTRATGDTASLISPLSNTSGSDPYCFRFWYHMFGVSHGSLNVFFQATSVNQSTVLIWSLSGNQGDEWHVAEVMIADYGTGKFVVEGVVGSPSSSEIAVDDVQYGKLCIDVSPYRPSNTSLVCDGTSMTVFLNRKELDISPTDAVTFKNSSCQGYDHDLETIAISTSFDDCGTSMTEDDERFVYSNHVHVVRSGVITEPNVEIEVNCSVKREYHVQISYRPRMWTKSFREEGYGNFTVWLYQYPDNNFDAPFPSSSYPRQVDIGDMIYLASQMESVTSLKIINEQCWATPSAHPRDSSRQSLIENGCPSADNVQVYPSEKTTMQPFSLKAFAFDSDVDVMYIHCDVLVCQQSDSHERCTQGCTQSRKRRESRDPRDASFSPHTISQGPFILQATSVDNTEGTQ